MSNINISWSDLMKEGHGIDDLRVLTSKLKVLPEQSSESVLDSYYDLKNAESELSLVLSYEAFERDLYKKQIKMYKRFAKSLTGTSMESVMLNNIYSLEAEEGDKKTSMSEKAKELAKTVFEKLKEFFKKLFGFIRNMFSKLILRIRAMFNGDLKNILQAFESNSKTKVKTNYILKGVSTTTFSNVLNALTKVSNNVREGIKRGDERVSMSFTMKELTNSNNRLKTTLNKKIKIEGDINLPSVKNALAELEKSRELYPALFGGTPTKEENSDLMISEIFDNGEQLSKLIENMASVESTLKTVEQNIMASINYDEIIKLENGEEKLTKAKDAISLLSTIFSSVSRGMSSYLKIINDCSFALSKKEDKQEEKESSENTNENKDDSQTTDNNEEKK